MDKTFAFKLPVDLYFRLRERAYVEQKSMADVARRAIEAELGREPDSPQQSAMRSDGQERR